jgi:hypothetical protein
MGDLVNRQAIQLHRFLRQQRQMVSSSSKWRKSLAKVG